MKYTVFECNNCHKVIKKVLETGWITDKTFVPHKHFCSIECFEKFKETEGINYYYYDKDVIKE